MSDPAATARAALGGIKEAVAVGREIKETAKEVNAFLDLGIVTGSVSNNRLNAVAT